MDEGFIDAAELRQVGLGKAAVPHRRPVPGGSSPLVHADMPPFYILAPAYSPYSGGPIALHNLCHYLNQIGCEAYVCADTLSGASRTPALSMQVVEAHVRAGRDPIAIYPEICIGNPLTCRRVVRYLLNRPGERGAQRPSAIEFWNEPGRRGEYLLHFADEFRLDHLRSALLTVPIIDQRTFWAPDVAAERKGYLVYSHRVAVPDEIVPDWARPYTRIEMANPRTPGQLAELYRKSRGLLIFERTGAQLEALMCGCPVLGVPNDYFRDFPMFGHYGNIGVGWGLDVMQLEWSARTLGIFQRVHQAYVDAFPAQLACRVEEAVRFFNAQDAASGS